jgi:phosphoribosylformylglycinamidine synthase
VKVGVIVFPGSNCDHDAYYVLKHVIRQEVVFLWHQDRDLQDVEAIIVPGGFSYGDYLRCGALAKFSPIMDSLQIHAAAGGPVLGICNGFQILQEAGLLPGALLRNANLKFLCQDVYLRVEQTDTPFTFDLNKDEILRIPIAHNDGSFFLPAKQLEDLENSGQVIFRYVDSDGKSSVTGNPNGSINSIAGIVNSQRNVIGMMPHPERASESILGSNDGLNIIQSMIRSLDRVKN